MIRFFTITLALLLISPMSSMAADSPNFIVFIGDDISAEDIGTYGHPTIKTPNIDGLAEAGMRFDSAFLTCSSCSPSRCSIMTSRYPHATGAANLHEPLPESQVVFPQLLKENGYYTAAAGKWHLGNAPKKHFDLIVGGGPSGCENWVKVTKERPKDKPFFFWFAAFDAHRAYSKGAIEEPHTEQDVVVPPYLADEPATREDLALYYDEVSRFDDYIGQVMRELEQQGAADNTVVIVMADNGRPFPRDKTTIYDTGIRTPFVVHWPSEVDPGATTDSLVSSIDIGATFLDLAGLDPAPSFQGVSFASVLRNPKATVRDFVFAEHNWHDYGAHERCVRNNRFLYIENAFPELPGTPPADAVRSLSYQDLQRMEASGELSNNQRGTFLFPRPAVELYDQSKDPHSLHNLVADPQYSEVLSGLRDELSQWRKATEDVIPQFARADGFHRRLGTRVTKPVNLKTPQDIDPIPPITRKIPPAGIEMPEEFLSEMNRRLRAANTALQMPRIHMNTYRYDVIALIKAVELAVDLGEFYSPAQFDIAREVMALAESRLKELNSGKAPWRKEKGLVVRGYRSSIDGSAQPYGLEIPEDLDLTRPVPLYVWLHGRGDKTTDLHFIDQRLKRKGRIAPAHAIVVHPFGRHCMGFKSAGEIDVLEVVEEVSRRYNIDRERVILMGFSMGGAGAWHIGAHYADQWAAVSPGAGFAETKEYNKMTPDKYPAPYVQKLWGLYDIPGYARNLFNLPVVAYSGENDKQIQAAQIMERAFEAEGEKLLHLIGPGMGHSYHPDTLNEITNHMLAASISGRPDMPKSVSIQTQTLRYHSAYWVTLTGLEKHWSDARADVQIVDDSITVKTKNVSSLRLSPKMTTVKVCEIDGTSINTEETESLAFIKRDGKWQLGEPKGLTKSPELQGPIDDAFYSPFVVVLPSAAEMNPVIQRWLDFEFNHFRDRWKSLYRGELPVITDKQLTSEMIRTYNLVLWGTPKTNSVIRRLLNDQNLKHSLPLFWSINDVAMGDQKFSSKNHLPLMIYPNPLNADKYVVINSGPTHREGHDRTNSLQNPKLPDWSIINLDELPNDVTPGAVVSHGFFDERWQVK
ncbi:MAG: sulfatase-like hydrolase/transferase [Pirellulaceae bacterium]